MDNTNYTTEHRKGQHLNCEERHDIEVHLKDGWSVYRIAKHLGRPYNTVKNEIAGGTVSLYHGKVKRYKANVVVRQFKDQGRSLDACVGNAMATGRFSRSKMVCTKTLYNYVDLGLLPIKNIDLPEKLRRNTKRKEVRENRKNLGRSIDERPESIESREEFGHWELDSVLGKKTRDDAVILTQIAIASCEDIIVAKNLLLHRYEMSRTLIRAA